MPPVAATMVSFIGRFLVTCLSAGGAFTTMTIAATQSVTRPTDGR